MNEPRGRGREFVPVRPPKAVADFVRTAQSIGARTPSERRLRPLVCLRRDAQLTTALGLFPELGAFLAALPRPVEHTG